MNRQQIRRIVRNSAKRAAAQVQRRADHDALLAMRAVRPLHSLPKRHPGKLLTSRRPYSKPHGKTAWRCIDQTRMPDGRLIPPGLEVYYHTTKGFTVTRLHAAA